MDAITRKGGLLYPMLVIAAISVIAFSVTGIATMMGWLPTALSGADRLPVLERTAPAGDLTSLTPGADSARVATAVGGGACAGCALVVSVQKVETPRETSWLGAAGGALVGGLLGHQVGRGGGRAAATVAGAGAGAYAGNEVEKRLGKSVRYRVRVRMEDGTYRTFHEVARPPYRVGESVRVTDHGIAPLVERRASVAAK